MAAIEYIGCEGGARLPKATWFCGGRGLSDGLPHLIPLA